MGLSQELSTRFKEVILNGKFIAFTNFKEQIDQLDYQEATTRIGSLNSPALLTFHIDYYIRGVNNLFENGKLEISDKYSFDMPNIESELQWQDLKTRLISNSEVFADHVAKLSDAQLSEVFVDPKYGTYLRNIEGMIEHCYYHFGQLVIISKMIKEQSVSKM